MTVRIVLVGTTHPGNIGAVARAMKNMAISELVLVRPRSFPHDDATARASGAQDILDAARVVGTLDEALDDCVYTIGTSARERAIGWPSELPREAAARIVRESDNGTVALVFGPEKTGLVNEDLDRCRMLVTIPTNPEYSSLNLAMAVQVLCYEIYLASHHAVATDIVEAPAAKAGDIEHFYVHLEQVLTNSGFLNPDNPRFLMRRLRRLFAKSDLDQNEINILRGILASLDPAAGTQDA